MIRNAIIALSAAAALGVALAPAAQAKNKLNFDVNVGLGGGFIGVGNYDDYGYGGGYVVVDDDCHYVKVKHVKKKYGKLKVWYTKELVCY